MSNIFLHYKKNNINLLYISCSILLICYGFYKNGILLYRDTNGNVLTLIRPILIPLIAIGVSQIINYIKNKKISINNNLIYILLLSLSVPLNINILVYTMFIIVISLFLEFLSSKLKVNINYIALFKILLILILFILHNYQYANQMELLHKYSYSLLDILFGRGISGVCTSSMILIIISYMILCTNYYYKKEIPFISLSVYFALALVFKFVFHKVIILNSLILYSLVFIASISFMSPVSKLEKMIYSIIIGILTFIFTYYFNRNDGVIFAIFIASFINFFDLK